MRDRYAVKARGRPDWASGDTYADQARRYLVNAILGAMRRHGVIELDASGSFRVLGPMRYVRDLDAIDHTGLKAAREAEVTRARQTLLSWQAHDPTMTPEEWAALGVVFGAR